MRPRGIPGRLPAVASVTPCFNERAATRKFLTGVRTYDTHLVRVQQEYMDATARMESRRGVAERRHHGGDYVWSGGRESTLRHALAERHLCVAHINSDTPTTRARALNSYTPPRPEGLRRVSSGAPPTMSQPERAHAMAQKLDAYRNARQVLRKKEAIREQRKSEEVNHDGAPDQEQQEED